MTAEMKAKWLEALRSGKYNQAKGHLREGDRFCALGVLCDIAGVEWTPDDEDVSVYLADGFASRAVPDRICDAINLDFYDHDDVASMNDVDGKSFAEIADWIQECVEVD